MPRLLLPLLLLALALTGCATAPPAPLPSPTIAVAQAASATPAPAPEPSATPLPTATPEPRATPAPTATAEPTATPLPSPTPDPFAGLSIASLRGEVYGQEGEIEIGATLASTPSFTRYQIAFPSDGLRVSGFMNVPVGDGPFPVVILNHGYMPPESYELLTYTTKYADALASAGFLVIHPSFRNHRGSDTGENPFRIGYARDVLHLIPMAQRLPQADGKPVGMWGHSMGGGVTLRVMTLTDQVRAAVLYGSMSGDEAKNYEAIMRWSNGAAAREGSLPEPPSNSELYAAISPLNYVEQITAAMAIHHGVLDDQVPFGWSQELAQRLDERGIPYQFYPYEEQNHNFTGAGYDLLNERVIAFFREQLR